MKTVQEMDREMEGHRQTNIASENEDIEQLLAFAETKSEMTEAEKQWHIQCVKYGCLIP